MSTVPVARQVRHAVKLADGSVRWEITTTIVDQGDMPFPELFVVTIKDPLDPKQDVLARVATPQEIRQADPSAPIYIKVDSTDLITLSGDPFARIANINDVTALPRDRVLAVRNGRTEYLVAAITLLYDNLTTAEAAFQTFIDRLSTLVKDWRDASGLLVTNPYQDYNLPQSEIGVEAQLAKAFADAKQKRLDAETQRDKAQSDKDECEVGCKTDKAIYDILVADVAFLERAKQIVQGITESFTTDPVLNLTFGTTLTTPGTYTITATNSQKAKDFALNQGSFAGTPESYDALLTQKRILRDQYLAKVRDCDTRCAQLGTVLAIAQNAVDGARNAENTALAAVLAVCPTFNPDTGALR